MVIGYYFAFFMLMMIVVMLTVSMPLCDMHVCAMRHKIMRKPKGIAKD
jgi:hypothetical protein